MTRLRGSLIAAAVPLLLLGACAQTGTGSVADYPSGPPESATAAAPAADDLVLRTESSGGFVGAGHDLTSIPEVSVYGDGRVIFSGPVPSIYPGPAMPNVLVQKITPEQVQELVRQGLAAGVRNGTDLGQPGVADATTTTITVVTAGGAQIVSANALQEAQSNDSRLTAAQQAARAKLKAYDQKLTALITGQGYGTPTEYVPAKLAVLAGPYVKPAGGATLPQVKPVAWTGPALPGSTIDAATKTGCLVVSGADKDKVLAAVKNASSATPWTVGSAQWHISFRPLLPDEDGCAALKGDR